MPRKSRLDIIKQRLGGKWTYDRMGSWHCTDGRRIYRSVTCECWMWENVVCNCPVKYVLVEGTKEREVDIDHPSVYRLNGKSTPKKKP
jgi:hypothetical protein